MLFIYLVRDPREVLISYSKHSGIGIDEIIDEIKSFREFEESNNFLSIKRSERKISEIDFLLNRKLKQELDKIKDTDKVKKAIKKLKDEKLEPDKVVELILNLLKENK